MITKPKPFFVAGRFRTAGIRRWLQTVSACLLPVAALAQAPLPSTGRLPARMAQATTDSVAMPDIRQAPAPTTAPSDGPTVDVVEFRLTGISTTQARDLLPLLDRYLGKSKTLADLEATAHGAQAALQRTGLFLAQVYVPAQDVVDGIVTLAVLEGRLGEIRLEVDDGVQVSRAFIEEVIAPLRGNPVAERGYVERALFTLSDLRGLSVTSTLSAGEHPGYADLTLKIAAGPRVGGYVEVDNYGSTFTGVYRLSVSLDWLSPGGLGDVASLNALTSTNGGTQFASGLWLAPINARGTRAGFSTTYLQYRLGTQTFEPLAAKGTAGSIAVQLLHPLVRSRDDNVVLQASAERRKSDDRVEAIPLDTKKNWASYVTLGAAGDSRDDALGGGTNNYWAHFIAGRLSIDSATDLEVDQSPTGYHSAGSYTKLVLFGSRVQQLPTGGLLYLTASAQAAQKNLDSSEKFILGGPNGVRGYPAGDSPSDSGALLTWEYRTPLRLESLTGNLVLSLFGDYGFGRIHQKPLLTDTRNIRRVVSHGLGLVFSDIGGWFARAYVAARGGVPAQSDDSRVRLWMLAGKQF